MLNFFLDPVVKPQDDFTGFLLEKIELVDSEETIKKAQPMSASYFPPW